MTKKSVFKLFIGTSLALVASCTAEDNLLPNTPSAKTEKQSIQRSSAKLSQSQQNSSPTPQQEVITELEILISMEFLRPNISLEVQMKRL